MTPVTILFVLILPLTVTVEGDFLPYRTAKDPQVSGSTMEFKTPGFDTPGGLTEGYVETRGVFLPDVSFPAHYLEVEVIETDMLDRHPKYKNCSGDFLRFYDGDSLKAPVLVDVCGSETPTFDTVGSNLFAVFHTNKTHDRVYKGAHVKVTAVYKKVSALIANRHTLGTFVFPTFGYSNQSVYPPVPPAIRRTITIEASNPKDNVTIFVNGTDMSGIDDVTGRCSRDKVIFYDGRDTSADVLATVCGTDTPTIHSTGRVMTAHFEGTALPDGVKNGMTFSYIAEGNSTDGNDGDNSPDGGTKASIAKAFVVVLAVVTYGTVY